MTLAFLPVRPRPRRRARVRLPRPAALDPDSLATSSGTRSAPRVRPRPRHGARSPSSSRAGRTRRRPAEAPTASSSPGVEPRAARSEPGEPSGWLAPVFRPGSSRVNVGFVEIGRRPPRPSSSSSGTGAAPSRAGSTVDLEPFGSRQVNDVHPAAARGGRPGRPLRGPRPLGRGTRRRLGDRGRQRLERRAPRHRVRGSAATPTCRPPPAPRASTGRSSGPTSSSANPSSIRPINVRVSYFPSKGTALSARRLASAACETRVFEDVLASLLGAARRFGRRPQAHRPRRRPRHRRLEPDLHRGAREELRARHRRPRRRRSGRGRADRPDVPLLLAGRPDEPRVPRDVRPARRSSG